jgi:hypothetical protein
MMISVEDCIGMCGLDADEVAAIAEHEHMPDIAAAAFANYLLRQAGGAERIRTMMIDDIHKALDDSFDCSRLRLAWNGRTESC